MFDIDKIFLSMKPYQKTDGKLNSLFEEGTMEYHQARLIDDYIALLCDTVENEDGTKTTRSMHMLHAAIDNDTDLLKDVRDDLEEGRTRNVMHSYDNYTLREQCRTKDEFITGKFGIGPFALNNNSQILTTLYEVEFAKDKNSIMTRLGLNSLHNTTDRDGESIMSWISGLINAHVDVAKDPYISRLNVNPYTYNLVNLLIRTGFGKSTFYFTTQPIMKELALVINNASGRYMVEKGVSLSKLKRNAEEQYIINMARANGINKKTYRSTIEAWKDDMKKRHIGINSAIDWLLSKEGIGVLRQIAKSGEGVDSSKTYKVEYMFNGKPDAAMLSVFDIQMLVYMANRQFAPYAEALSNLVKYSKIDTKKHGKSILEQKQYLQGYRAMFDSDSKDKNRMLFKTDGLDRMRDGSYIGEVTENAVDVFSRIMGSLVIQGTDRFIGKNGLVDQVLDTIGRYGTTDALLLRSVTSSILAKKKSTFFNQYAEDNNIDTKGLVDGNNTIFDRLCKLKSEIICTDKYASLRDKNGNIANYMLRTLVAGYTHEFSNPKNAPYGTVGDDYHSVKFINTLNFIDDESIDQDEFTQAWEDLMNDGRFPELLKFATDLVMYAFVTAGDNGGRNDLMKLVPNSWKIKSGYVDAMVKLLDSFNSLTINNDSVLSQDDMEDIILNNWYDDNFVHTLNVSEYKEFFSKITQTDGSIKATEFATIIGLPSDTNVESNYIKVERSNITDRESQRRYIVYKYVGNGTRIRTVLIVKDGKIIEKTETEAYPIYVAVEPKGNKFTDRQYILSYGRSETANESMINLALDALAKLLLVQRGIKVISTQDAFNKLSEIFNEITPATADAIRSIYESSIQEVVEDYNRYNYIEETPIEEESDIEKIPDTAEEAKKENKRIYVVPEAEIKKESTKDDTASNLSDKQIALGLNENNDQDPNAVKQDRPYDPTSQYSELRYLINKVKNYIKEHYAIKDGSFASYKYTLAIKNITAKIAKLAIADTGGYVNDFSIKEVKEGVGITARHTDNLTLDKLADAGKELRKKCE